MWFWFFVDRVFSYIGHPTIVRIPKKVPYPLFVLLMLTAICLILGVAGGFISDMLIHFKMIPGPGPSILDEKSVTHFQFFIGSVLIAPVLEELIFRAQLRRISWSIGFIAFICGVLLSAITGTYWAFLISPFIFTVLFLIYRYTIASDGINSKFRFWTMVYPWYFHFTAICFALVHLSNFEKGIALLPLGILYTLPQLGIGFVLGFTRMNFGLKYSIAVHSLYNLALTILLLSKY